MTFWTCQTIQVARLAFCPICRYSVAMTTNTSALRRDPANHDARVGERVMMLMFRARITQTALAKRVGMTQAGLSKKIHGDRKWSLDDLYVTASALGVSIHDLLDDATAPTPATMNPQELDYKAAVLAPVITLHARPSAGAVA